MRPTRIEKGWLLAAGLIAGSLVMAGCRPTYPAGSADDAIAKICSKEYKVHVQVKHVGRTIGALVVMHNILLDDLTLADYALNRVENVMLTTSRVTLSSDFQYDFFVITIRDAAAGVDVSFVRYVKDVRRLVADDISRNDFFQRMLIEVRTVPGPNPAVEPYELPEYRMGDFLARQIGERLQTQTQTNMVAQRLFKLAAIEGSFLLPSASTNADRWGRFQIRLETLAGFPDFEMIATPAIRQDFYKSLLQNAKTVIRRYEFKNFDGLEIVDGQGRLLIYFDSKAFEKESVNALMDLLRNFKANKKY